MAIVSIRKKKKTESSASFCLIICHWRLFLQVEHSSANSVLSFIIFNLVALFTHMESFILGDPGEVSRDYRIFVVKVLQ